MNASELKAAQIAIEEEGLGLGIKKYREQLAQGQADLAPGMSLIADTVVPLTKRLEEELEATLKGRPGRAASLYMYLAQFDCDLIAYVTAKTVINTIGRREPLTSCARNIARTLTDTLNHETLKAEAPKLYRKLQEKIEKSSDTGYRHIVLKKQMQYAKIAMIKWDKDDAVRLGTLLITFMAEETGLVELVKDTQGHKDTPYFIVAKEGLLEALEKSHASCELLSPVMMPMVCRPKTWTNPFDGGFYTKAMRFPIMKTGNMPFLTDLAQYHMPIVYHAMEAMQNTEWCSNMPVLEVMEKLWEAGKPVAGLPIRLDPEEEKKKNVFLKDPKEFPEEFKAHKQMLAAMYETLHKESSKRVAMVQKLWLARKFSAYECFYFAYAMCWRGRAYPVAAVLNPQGDDSTKALITFKRKKALGARGAYWLRVHGANTYGVDKVSYDERTKWVAENTEMILESANNPLDGSRRWADADSPFMFLAFCFEYRDYCAHIDTGADGSTFESHLPVSFDGVCNGLQNYSALLRDEIGGKATGLVPGDKPADIYTDVMKVAQARIDLEAGDYDETSPVYHDLLAEARAAIAANKKKKPELRKEMPSETELVAEYRARAKFWVGRMTRKLSKSNTMTTPYSVSPFGMRGQIIEEFEKQIEDAKKKGQDVRADYPFKHASFLAAKNRAAIAEVVVASCVAMKWLQEVSVIVAKNDLPVQWTSPSGLRVLQRYLKREDQILDFTVSGKRFQLVLKRETGDLDAKSMAAGISANFVHSLDAAHMMRTVSYCVEAGVESFAMIHDSFGAHAGDAETLSTQLRRAFVDQYTPNVLEDFRQQLEAQIPEELGVKLPPIPAMGNLDLAGVMDSKYFFA